MVRMVLLQNKKMFRDWTEATFRPRTVLVPVLSLLIFDLKL